MPSSIFCLLEGYSFLGLILFIAPIVLAFLDWKNRVETQELLIATISPTRGFAIFRKKMLFNTFDTLDESSKQRIEKEWTEGVVRWNYVFLFVFSAGFIFYWICFQDLDLSEFQKIKDKPFAYLFIIILGYFSISRIAEILIAFVNDAKDRLQKSPASTLLSRFDRLALMLKSYVELTFSFSMVYFLLHAYSFPLFKSHDKNMNQISDLYFYSVGVITTLGTGTTEPFHISTKILTATEVLSGLTLLVLVLAIYISSEDPSEVNTKNDSKPAGHAG